MPDNKYMLNTYISQGFKLLPCHGKLPLTKHGFKDASSSAQDVERWTKAFPDGGWGISCGSASGLTVIDVDKKNEGIENFMSLIPEDCEDSFSYVVTTPNGGLHFYFAYDPDIKTTTGLLPGVDVRNDGSYVVAPPSPGYKMRSEAPKLGGIPKWLKSKLVGVKKPQVERTLISEGDSLGDIGEGGRNAFLTRIGGSLRKYGMEEDAIYAILETANNARCNPPVSHTELQTIARSVSRYTPDSTLTFENDEIVSIVRAKDMLQDTISYLNDKDLVKGEPTGITGLDELLGGGKRLGEVTAWHAEAKTGKNTLWHYKMNLWLRRGMSLGYASRELSPATEVIPNLLSIELSRNAWLEDLDPAVIAEHVNKWDLYFASGYGYMPFPQIVTWMTTLSKEHNVKYFFIDHLHYCLEDPEEHKEASKLAKLLKKLAKDLNVHIDLIIQPNKLMEGQRLSLNSIKGGSAIGQAVDNLITLRRIPELRTVMQLTLDVGRSKLCTPGTIYLEYDKNTTRFREVDLEVTETRDR